MKPKGESTIKHVCTTQLMTISPFVAHLNHFSIPCGSSAVEILCLLDTYFQDLRFSKLQQTFEPRIILLNQVDPKKAIVE